MKLFAVQLNPNQRKKRFEISTFKTRINKTGRTCVLFFILLMRDEDYVNIILQFY